MERWFTKGTLVFEQLTTVLLAIVALLGIASFGAELVRDFSLRKETLAEWVDFALLLFVIIELMRIAQAYLRETALLPLVFEAVLVAIARKVIAFDTERPDFFIEAIALALLFIATAVTWAVLRKAHAISESTTPKTH